jgi:hypothetical protein
MKNVALVFYKKCVLKQGFYAFLKSGLNVTTIMDTIIISNTTHIRENMNICDVPWITIGSFRDWSTFPH